MKLVLRVHKLQLVDLERTVMLQVEEVADKIDSKKYPVLVSIDAAGERCAIVAFPDRQFAESAFEKIADAVYRGTRTVDIVKQTCAAPPGLIEALNPTQEPPAIPA